MSAAGSVGAARWRGAVWDNESATVSVVLFSVVLFRSWAVGCVRFGGGDAACGAGNAGRVWCC